MSAIIAILIVSTTDHPRRSERGSIEPGGLKMVSALIGFAFLLVGIVVLLSTLLSHPTTWYEDLPPKNFNGEEE